MKIFEQIKNFLTGRISDEEFEANEWVYCHKCQTYILKEDFENNDGVCPHCGASFSDNVSGISDIINFCKVHEPLVTAVVILILISFLMLLQK